MSDRASSKYLCGVELLWTGEVRSTRKTRVEVRSALQRGDGFGQAEIDHFDHQGIRAARIICEDHKVARFQIAMHQLVRLRRHERPSDLGHDLQRRRRRQRTIAAHTRFERLALDQFHRIETLARSGFAEVEDAGHIRMSQLRGDAGLTPKTLPRFGLIGITSADDLERDGRSEIHIERMIGDSHRAAAELIERAVLAQADLVVLEAAALDSGFTQAGEEQAVHAA